jgi:hypothetical protein
VAYAYQINKRRPENDPGKRKFRRSAIFLVPLTWPLMFIAYAALFLIMILAYALFLFLIIFGLLIIRKSPLLAWLQNTATKTGNRLLELYTTLIDSFLGK